MESETLKVRCLHPVHYLVEHPRGAVIDLPVETANHLAKHGIVEILSTIVDLPVEILAEVKGETVPSSAPQETETEAQEEAPKAPKKTSKRRDSDDE
jgi:hypothetical protein